MAIDYICQFNQLLRRVEEKTQLTLALLGILWCTLYVLSHI